MPQRARAGDSRHSEMAEPGEQWVREGLHHEVVEVFGQALVEHKRPRFDYNGQFEFTGFGRTFDVIAAFSVFIHCGREQLATCLANVRAVMTPETILLLDLNIGDASYERGKHSKYAWASHQKIRYTREDAEAMLEQGGYTHEVVDERYSERKDKTRTLFRLRLPRASRALE